MSQRSPFQRFIHELRRRHVPQTAAVYLVAAWAAIQFADVVAPNLGWPQGVVTAVIIAAAVGFPAVLVLAWVFELGPDGIHRTDDETPGAGMAGGARPAMPSDARTRGHGSEPWVAAMAVLVVAIGSAVGVTLLLNGGGSEGGSGGASAAEAEQGTEPGGAKPDGREAGGRGTLPAPPVPGIAAPGMEGVNAQDWEGALKQAMTQLEALDSAGGVERLRELGDQMVLDRSVLIGLPEGWAEPQHMTMVHAGDTVVVEGVARDSAGVASVAVDGRVVAEAKPARSVLAFKTQVVASGSDVRRTVPLVVRLADGREIRREYQLLRIP